jgi:RNA polymerase sigma factor (sigma-70 family)
MIAEQLTDRDLLLAFSAKADQAAFAELVRRHGPLVLGVCRRVLNDSPEAEDAFQAVFLVLARKARSLLRPELLGNWLYGVALRCARRVRSRQAQRLAREQPVTELPAPDPVPDAADWKDVRPILDEEIARLPDKLRAAVVLCELEGVPRPEAAHRLGVPEGTLSSRLARGKDTLRRRLLKRGIALTAIGLGVVLGRAAPAAVPPALVQATTTAAIGFAAGTKAATVAAGIATREVQVMFWAKAVKVVALATVGAIAASGVAVAYLEGVAVERSEPGVLRQVHDTVFRSIHGISRDKKSDKDKFQGEWKVTALMFDGKDGREQLPLKSATFTGDKVVLGEDHEGEFKLGADKTPKHCDMKLTAGPHPGDFHGIYKLEDDKLTLHFTHPPGVDRPADFECKEGGKTILIVMERTKK